MIPLVEQIDAALPQTQCTRCGFPDCRAYATAMADGSAGINHCPPGGTAGIAKLAAVTGRPALPLDSTNGREGPRLLAIVDESWCIGCTLCLDACPVDCIVGAPKAMHTVIDAQCTGCELCVPVCPVDCIALVPHPDAGWTGEQAADARQRYAFHRERTERRAREADARLAASGRGAAVAAALQHARDRSRP